MRGGNRESLMNKVYCHTICFALLSASSIVFAQENPNEERKTKEPVFRVSKLTEANSSVSESAAVAAPAAAPAAAVPAAATGATPHPLDRAINIARVALTDMREQVRDYTAIMVKRESVNGVLGETEYMQIKIRCPRQTENGPVPFSVYMKFLKPRACAGREVIWVDGQNDGKLIAHEASGIGSMKRFYLEPTGWLAMKGNRYPIHDAGLENLILKLIEKGERDRAAGYFEVNYREGAVINKRPCSVIELRHDERKPPFEFCKAQVFVDDELQLPVRYAAYEWPDRPGDNPKLLEEYTYVNLKLNVGLTDQDFRPENPSYSFPRR